MAGSTPPAPAPAACGQLPDLTFLHWLPTAAYVVAADGRLVCWNAHAVAIWGREPRSGEAAERFCGSYRLRRTDGTPIAHAQAPVAQVLASGQPIHGAEAICARPDGSWVWTVLQISPLTDVTGSVVGALAILIDVSSRMSLEQALAAQHRQFEVVTDALPACVAYVDHEQRYRFVSKGSSDWIGRPREDLVGRTVAEVVGPVTYARVEPHIRAALAGTSVSYEAEVPHREGLRLTRLDYIPDVAGDGTVQGYTVMAQDISAIKRAERALATTAEELKRSNAELEQFAYITSHDLQEPLRMIGAHLALLRSRLGDGLDAKSERSFQIVIESAARMKAMIDAVLRYARVDREDPSPTPVPLAEVAQDAISDLAETIQATGARVHHEALPTVQGNRALLSTVVRNLLSNALKFRGADAPVVRISAQEEPAGWVIQVEDNGIGIDPRQQERLFRLFQRLHARERYGGEGIGLATCKRIIERLGGHIWIHSLPGQGTRICFRLPKATPAASPRTPVASAATPLRVAIVDDNPGDIALLEEVIQAQAPTMAIAGASSGHALIAHLGDCAHDQLPACILIDLNMPDMDGRAVLSYLKHHPRYQAIPAIIYTSSLRQTERQQCLELGADDYIIKPARIEECEAVLRRIRQVTAASRDQEA